MEQGLQFGIWLALLLLIVPFLGRYMAYVFRSDTMPFPLERWIYRLCQIDPTYEMGWREYLKALLYFNLFGFLLLFVLQLTQQWLPLNPQHLAAVDPLLALNTALSFVTNTNWQAYGGEVTMSYFTQMAGLTVQNFASAATGNAVLLALIRGITRSNQTTLGNFWRDVTRTILYLLLPLSVALSLFLVSQGVIQNLEPYQEATTLSGEIQILPMGPVASQVAIKQLGTNGGGFFNANSAHPFENPTPWSNLAETLALIAIPAAATYMYGLMILSKKQGWILFTVMSLLWLLGFGMALASQLAFNPVLEANPVLEGQEMRFGSLATIVWSVTTTGTSNGSVNAMQASLAPLAGGVAMVNMMLGEVIFGGVGVGLCGMLMFVLLTVFLAGLMVGRTPEYLGKKIEKREIQWVMWAILTPCCLILLGSSLAALLPAALESLSSTGPHGLSEILYTFSSAAANNGSSFSGLQANTPFYNLILGVVMLLARLAILIPSVAIAGCLVQKRVTAPSLGTFTTDHWLFGVSLLGVILIVAALTFFPALSLGPILEHLLLLRGQSF